MLGPCLLFLWVSWVIATVILEIYIHASIHRKAVDIRAWYRCFRKTEHVLSNMWVWNMCVLRAWSLRYRNLCILVEDDTFGGSSYIGSI